MTNEERAMEQLEAYLMRRRQAILVELGEIEDALKLPRTKEPNHRRRER